jgi:DNA-binding response OmpR family regulator
MRRASRVLLVDDKDTVRESLQLALFDFNCAFAETSSGMVAVDMARRERFDVIFLDVKLPDIDGITVLRRLREDQPDPPKVIILTALPDAKTEAEALAYGAFAYLRKPLQYDQIRSVFAEATDDTAHKTAAPFVSPILAQAALAVAKPPHDETLPRILVLDDSEDWLDQIQEVLKADFEVMRTTDDVDACRWASSDDFSLVVVEKSLGHGVTGMDVISRMRMSDPDLRAIILSDYSDYTFPHNRHGAIVYVSKKDLGTLPSVARSMLHESTKRKHVFLSYDSADRERVVELYEALMSHGFLPWLDFKSITPGKKWETEIRKAIDECDFFVFCLSKSSIQKDGTIRKELRQALDRQNGLSDEAVFIVTARLEECAVLGPLKQFQFVDLFEPRGIGKLLTALSLRK